MKPKLLYLLLFIVLQSCEDRNVSNDLITSINLNLKEEQYIFAEKEIQKLIKIEPSNSEAYLLKGIVETKQKDYNSALLSFKKSIALDSTNYKALVERANLKIVLGDYKSAIKDCSNAQSLNETYFQVYQTKGKIYETIEDLPNAILEFEKAIKYGDNSGITYFKLGVLFLKSGNETKGCEYLSKAGELGFMKSFDIIKSVCNDNYNQTNGENNQTGIFKSYPNKYAITFPKDWDVDEISNSNKSILTVSASKEGHFMSILEHDPTLTDLHFKANSVFEIDKEKFLFEYRRKYSDFKLHDFEKKQINGIDTYYFNMSYSFYSTKLRKELSGYNVLFVLLNSETKKLYYFLGNANENDINEYIEIYSQTFNTFTLL